MKRRKKTNSKVPAKGRLRDMADRLWSLAVRIDWGERCAVCANPRVEAHHLVPRQRAATRYEMRNGIALCASHHKFDPLISPHLNSAAWMEFLDQQYPASHNWLVEHHSDTFTGTRNAEYYCQAIRNLRQYVDDYDYRTIVGQRFSDWLEYGNDD